MNENSFLIILIREVNYKNTLRNYNSNHNYSNSMSLRRSHVSNNLSIINNYNYFDNSINKNENSNLQKIKEDDINKNFTLIKNRIVHKEGNLMNFINSKNKIRQRLNLMSKEKMNMNNYSLGKRIIIKDIKNTIIDDGLSKTSKCYNMN